MWLRLILLESLGLLPKLRIEWLLHVRRWLVITLLRHRSAMNTILSTRLLQMRHGLVLLLLRIAVELREWRNLSKDHDAVLLRYSLLSLVAMNALYEAIRHHGCLLLMRRAIRVDPRSAKRPWTSVGVRLTVQRPWRICRNPIAILVHKCYTMLRHAGSPRRAAWHHSHVISTARALLHLYEYILEALVFYLADSQAAGRHTNKSLWFYVQEAVVLEAFCVVREARTAQQVCHHLTGIANSIVVACVVVNCSNLNWHKTYSSSLTHRRGPLLHRKCGRAMGDRCSHTTHRWLHYHHLRLLHASRALRHAICRLNNLLLHLLTGHSAAFVSEPALGHGELRVIRRHQRLANLYPMPIWRELLLLLIR
mmetsp:Transcript_7160/g.11637  ORF Transcript_7160/g.11637 Transcript_7160/m.11637 type:complete len:366 (-) Transcript_7160:815-1912(-)